MSRSGKRYPKEFQQSSAKLAIESEQAISKTANNLGIDPNTLRNWIQKHYPNYKPKTSVDITQDSLLVELKALRKKVSRLTEERDILKKATAYFARENE